jgi:DNA polymerase-1
MTLQVHDELVFDAHRSEVEWLREVVRTSMEGAVQLQVPLIADIGTGDDWLDAK